MNMIAQFLGQERYSPMRASTSLVLSHARMAVSMQSRTDSPDQPDDEPGYGQVRRDMMRRTALYNWSTAICAGLIV